MMVKKNIVTDPSKHCVIVFKEEKGVKGAMSQNHKLKYCISFKLSITYRVLRDISMKTDMYTVQYNIHIWAILHKRA
jgi:hypothetical protein